MKTKIFALLVLPSLLAAEARAEAPYQVDPEHSAVIFKALHMGAGYTYGRFRAVSGSLVMDLKNPEKSSVNIEVDAASVYTGNKQRDTHLQSPDFLNVKQYPTITFKSTAIKRSRGGADISGLLNLRGVERSITVKMTHVGTGKDPTGNQRAGFEGTFSIKLADYGVKAMPGVVGEQIHLIVAVEGMRK